MAPMNSAGHAVFFAPSLPALGGWSGSETLSHLIHAPRMAAEWSASMTRPLAVSGTSRHDCVGRLKGVGKGED